MCTMLTRVRSCLTCELAAKEDRTAVVPLALNSYSSSLSREKQVAIQDSDGVGE